MDFWTPPRFLMPLSAFARVCARLSPFCVPFQRASNLHSPAFVHVCLFSSACANPPFCGTLLKMNITASFGPPPPKIYLRYYVRSLGNGVRKKGVRNRVRIDDVGSILKFRIGCPFGENSAAFCRSVWLPKSILNFRIGSVSSIGGLIAATLFADTVSDTQICGPR